jgi:predicted  nucleic acid-binding Zn-ribbon protein
MAQAIRAIGPAVLAGLLLGGCATYQDTNRKLETGYYSDLQVQANREQQLAQDDQMALKRDLTTLQQEQQSASAEQADLQKQLAKVETDLAAASSQLEKARAENRVGRADYDRLKAELDSLQLQQQKQSLVPGTDAEKRRQLEALQKKKDALQKAIQALGATS